MTLALRPPTAAELEELDRILEARQADEAAEIAQLDREWEKADLPDVQYAHFMHVRRQELHAQQTLYPAQHRRVRAEAIAPPRRLS